MSLSRPRIVWITVAVLLIAALALIAFGPNEPSYHGKSLSVWLDEGRQYKELGDPFAEIIIDTPRARAIRAMGKDALPALLRMAATRDTPLRKKFLEFSQNNEWLALHVQPFSDIQFHTAYGFAVLGPAAKPALPKLIRLLDDPAPEVRIMAAFALGKIGPDAVEAVPALRKALARSAKQSAAIKPTGDETLIAYALGRMGADARSALPEIALLQQDPNIIVREAADAALVRITGTGLPPAIEALKDTSNSTNWLHAARIVMSAGTNGAVAIPLLLAALQSTNQSIHGEAVRALGRIHMQPEICIPALAPFFQATITNGFVRAVALEAIGNFGVAARGFAPVSGLIGALDDPDQWVREHATNALRRVDPEAAAKAGVD